MPGIYHCAQELIGNTPLLELCAIQKKEKLPATVLAKLEYRNPAGSVKDRVALSMIITAENAGLLKPGSVIIEPTSGNTGIGLASVAASRGYRAIIVMPDSMSKERQLLMQAYGAELVLTPGAQGMQGAIDRAKALSEGIPDSFIPGQFDNPANPTIHYATTGPEIWKDTGGNVDILVCGVGTGGTLTGTGRYLKEQNPNIKIVAVEPANSPLLSKGLTGSHGLQGIGANFIPSILDREIYDEVITVTEPQAYAAARLVAKTEGILVGISSGAALHGALTLARQPENIGKTIVTVFPDSGERYLSTPLYQYE